MTQAIRATTPSCASCLRVFVFNNNSYSFIPSSDTTTLTSSDSAPGIPFIAKSVIFTVNVAST